MSPLVGRVRRHEELSRLSRPEGRATRYPISVAFAHRGPGQGPGAEATPRVEVAYAVGRRNGTAIVRNRLRRRLRSAVGAAAAKGALHDGLYLVRAEPAAKELGFGPLCDAVSEAMTAAAGRAGQGPKGAATGLEEVPG